MGAKKDMELRPESRDQGQHKVCAPVSCTEPETLAAPPTVQGPGVVDTSLSWMDDSPLDPPFPFNNVQDGVISVCVEAPVQVASGKTSA